MNSHHQLFGRYVPGGSLVHRLPAGAKMLGLTLLTLVTLALQQPVASVSALALVLALLLASRLPLRTALWPGWLVVVLAVGLGAWHAVSGRPDLAALVVANLLSAVYGGRLLVLTTPVPAVVEAIGTFLRPLRVLGVNPDHVGLAVGIMLRSVPHLLGSFDEVGQAARARGQERNVIARVTPVVVHAVAYAQATGDALAARGLGDE